MISFATNKFFKIALLTDGIYPYTMGGMQKHSFYLAKRLAQKGIHVDVYYAYPENQKIPSFKNEYSPEELQYIRLLPIRFPCNSRYPGHYIWESYIYSQRVHEEFLTHSLVDFVYVQGFSGWALMKHYRSKRKKDKREFPVGINFHGVEMFQKAPSFRVKLEHLILRPFVKYNLKNADYVFSLGGKLTTIQQRLLPHHNIIELPIGITQDWINDTSKGNCSGNIKFVFIGRYERRKGIQELNYVLKRIVADETNNFECHFIGPIPEYKQIKNQSNIIYHGVIHDEARIKEILQSSDVLLCPSWSEGMPTVILEAMACGCAIIATDVGAVSEQVDGSNGILIRAGDQQQLKFAIKKMLSIPKDELIKLKNASVERIKEKFLWDRVAKRTITEIDNIIEETNRKIRN